jgi:multidrug efflux pump subunit AcrB
MNIGKFSIKFKYFVLALTIAIMIFGLYSRATLKSQLSPDTNSPAVTVMAQYPGASAQDVIKDVVKPMEDVFGSLDGIKNIKSTGQDNIAYIRLDFNYGINVDQAAIDVQNALSRIDNQLPNNLPTPKVLKFNTSDKPIVTISLSSDSVDLKSVRQLAEEKIAFELQLVDGVASVNYFGGYESEVQILLDRNQLNNYGLTLDQVNQTLATSNIKAPGGKITDNNKEILVRVEEEFLNIDDLKELKIKTVDGNSVYLGDLGEITITEGEKESAYIYQDSEAIAIMVTKKTDANTVEVVENIKNEIENLEKKYPFIHFELAQDDSVFTTQMIDNMTTSVLMALLFTMLIIILFIVKINQSLVVGVSMPLVFMSTLGLMKAFGMKLDMVTLSALILSIGFVVDAAIVVVENIMAHFKSKGIVEAAIDGTNEIALPSIAGVTTTLIVLIPLLFIEGFVGEMFRPLAMTIIFAITSSIIIALIIIPLFSVLFDKITFYRVEKIIRVFTNPFNKTMEWLLNIYTILLKKSLKHKTLMFASILILMGLSVYFMANNGLEMLPKFDGGTSFVSVELEGGSKVEDTQKAVSNIQDFLKNEENVISYDIQIGYEKDSSMIGDFGIMGTNQALFTINLKPRTEREETIWEFQERLRSEIEKIPDIKRFVVKEKGGTATSSSSAPLDIRVTGEDEDVLFMIATDMKEKIQEIEGTTNIYLSANMDNQQIMIKTDDNQLQKLGLSNAIVSRQIYTAIEGVKSTTMDIDDAENLEVFVMYEERYRESIDDLMDVKIVSPAGTQVPLREIAEIETETRTNIITKENMEHTIDIYGYTEGRAYSHITSDINKVIENYPVPSGFNIELTGESADMGESMRDMIFLLILAIVFVYLILVPQFKSFLHPLTIMMSIPLVVIGVAPALWLADMYISMPVLLGFILLAGTVVNNAILVINQIISNREKDMAIEDSVVNAIQTRFRPVMMTALSDVVGMLPLALQLALGSERFSPLAVTVIGGILSATFLTLIVIPVLFVVFEKADSLAQEV